MEKDKKMEALMLRMVKKAVCNTTGIDPNKAQVKGAGKVDAEVRAFRAYFSAVVVSSGMTLSAAAAYLNVDVGNLHRLMNGYFSKHHKSFKERGETLNEIKHEIQRWV